MRRPTAYLFVLALGLLLFGLPASVSAEVLFLPFAVHGTPHPAVGDAVGLRAELAEAARFLFHTQKDFPVRPSGEARRSLERKGLGSLWRGDLTADRARRLCAAVDADTLMLGSAEFRSAKSATIRLRSFGCRGGSTLARAQRHASWNNLQTTLVDLLIQVTPFAPIRPEARINTKTTALPIVAIVDASGSMAASLPLIREGLARRMQAQRTKASVYAVGGAQIKNANALRSARELAAFFGKLRAAGETSAREIAAAISLATRTHASGAQLLVFTDADDAAGLDQMENKLRYFSGRGFSPHLFELPSAALSQRRQLVGMARALGAPDARVVYGNEVRYVTHEPDLVISYGGRLYHARGNMLRQIAANQPLLRQMQSLPQADTLQSAATLLARQQNARVAGIGPLLSGLESALEGSGSDRPAGAARYRALVKNSGQAFWIGISSQSTFRRLQNLRGKKVYLGLRLRPGAGQIPGMTNHPEFVYIRSQSQVPRLLINEWTHLNRLPKRLVRPTDVWFLFCEILQLKGAR